MGDENKDSVAVERSADADGVIIMNPTSSSGFNKSKRPNSLKIELLRIRDESARNSYVLSQNDVNISFRNISYTVKHGVLLHSKFIYLFF